MRVREAEAEAEADGCRFRHPWAADGLNVAAVEGRSARWSWNRFSQNGNLFSCHVLGRIGAVNHGNSISKAVYVFLFI
jgi:hypothetical protein